MFNDIETYLRYNDDIENLCNISFFSILNLKVTYDFNKIYKSMNDCFSYFNNTTKDNDKDLLFDIFDKKCHLIFKNDALNIKNNNNNLDLTQSLEIIEKMCI